MARASDLANDNVLWCLDAPLDPGELPWRTLYGTDHLVQWLQDQLPGMETQIVGGEIHPLEQVDALFARFAAGEPLVISRQFRRMHPHEQGVWELKTPDVRIFGWFSERDHFVAAYGDDASRVKDHNLYAGYIAQTVRVRTILGCTFIEGRRYEEVLSNRP